VAVGAGIGASLGFARETTPGTIVSPTRWAEFNSETLGLGKVVVQGQGLRGGGLYPRTSRRVVVGRNAGGDINMDIATNGMGLLFESMLGGTSASAVVTGTAYQQIHQPGNTVKSLTVQKLVPEMITGTLKPFTYNGCKVTSWTINFAKDQIATLSLTLDAWDETTGTAAGTPSYSASTNVFHFLQAALILGGTASTTSGLVSVTGGSAVAGITGGSITGSTGIRSGSDNRYINGKIEQGQNDWRGVSGSLGLDFISQADVVDLFNADTGATLKLTFTGTTAITGSTYPVLEVLIPRIFFDGETPKVGGPGVISLTAPFTGGDDGTNAALQIRYVTSDTSVS
jgi:hypothetical protein